MRVVVLLVLAASPTSSNSSNGSGRRGACGRPFVAFGPVPLRFVDTTRVDRWLHAVRAIKTRTAASDACRGGHVKVNGKPARASTPVRVGDRVVLRGTRHLDLEVLRVIDKRVGASVAADCFVDHTPPPPPSQPRVEEPFRRDPGSGRPTKKDRRQLDRLRGRR